MKVKKLWYVLAICLTFLLSAAFSACSKDEGLPDPPQPPEEEVVGEVNFSVSTESGSGSGTTESPAVVEQGDTLDMAISQKSSYTDPDGSVFICEPKATIKLYANIDTLHAKDLQTLIKVAESSNQSSEVVTASNVRTEQTLQKFNVGGQEITFDLAHEIYNYVNSQNKNIEMPYIKINSAKYGAAETTAQTRGTATVKGIKLKPCAPQTRGSVTDTTAYEVSVDFNLEIESVHTSNDNKQTLSFEVTYIAVVESTTEFPDPTMDYGFELEILGGTYSTYSPFIKKPGETLALLWKQSSQYSYFVIEESATETIAHEPNAAVSVTALKDTLWVSDLADLEKITAVEPTITTEGENPLKNIGKASFTSGEQVIDVDWNYESYPTVEIDGKEITWPYIVLGTPEIVNVSVTDNAETVISGKEAKVVDVSVRIKQNLSTVNVPEDQRVSQDVQYIVRYIGVMEVELVDVKYRKEYEWLEPHDNIPLASRYILYRDRTYSTGEVFTDVFTSMNCAVEGSFVITIRGGDTDQLEDKEVMIPGDVPILYHKNNYTLDQERRQYQLNTTKTGVPDLSKLSTYTAIPEEYATIVPGDFENYVLLGGGLFSEEPQEAWYFRGIERRQCKFLRYKSDEDYVIRDYDIAVRFYDRFLYLDGQIFDFLDYKMTYDFDFREEDITMPDGAPAKVFTHEIKAKYLDRDFYVAEIDTVYQRNFEP